MNVGYLVNVYPKVSHAFIRREIQALVALGISVHRFTVRRADEQLVDPDDLAEERLTHVLLEHKPALILSTLRAAFTRPTSFIAAARAAIRLGRASGSSGAGVIKHFIYLAEAAALSDACRRQSITHLHAHFGTNPAAVALLCRLLGGPTYSFTVHGPDEFDAPMSLDLGQKIAHCKFVVAISDFGASQLKRWCPTDQWSRIEVVRCGVDAAFLSAGPQAITGDHFVCVGRLAGQKGHFVLLEALALLQQDGLRPRVELVGDGPLRQALQSRVCELGLESQVTFLGNRSAAQVREHLISARAMVLPSFAEGLPVVIMESLALGRPVVTTYIAGIPELVRPSHNGWLVPSGNAAALGGAMAACLQTPLDKLHEMGAAGASDVAARHDALIEGRRLAELFLSGSKPPSSRHHTSSPNLSSAVA